MRDIKELVLAWYTEDDGTEEEFNYCEKFLTEVHNDEVHHHKWVTYSTVFKDTLTEKYYEAWVQRIDDGYWGECEVIGEGCFEVVPKEVVSIVWEKVDV